VNGSLSTRLRRVEWTLYHDAMMAGRRKTRVEGDGCERRMSCESHADLTNMKIQ
jgi:hypothetical protein